MHSFRPMMASARQNLVVLGIAAMGGWIVGCSGGGGGDPEVPPNGGLMLPSAPAPGASSTTNEASTSSSSSSSTGGGSSADACVAKCEAKYPKGAQLARAIDTCWSNSCDACLAMGKGAPQGPESGSCKTDVYTPSAACSQCTVESCCSTWDACFSNAECKALNACAVACAK